MLLSASYSQASYGDGPLGKALGAERQHLNELVELNELERTISLRIDSMLHAMELRPIRRGAAPLDGTFPFVLVPNAVWGGALGRQHGRFGSLTPRGVPACSTDHRKGDNIMDVSTTFRHLEPSEALRDYGNQKVTRLQKFLRQPMIARITLSVEKHEHVVEVQLDSGGQHFEAKETSSDMYASIDSAAHKLERQIHDAKGVASSRRRKETDVRHAEPEGVELAMAASDR